MIKGWERRRACKGRSNIKFLRDRQRLLFADVEVSAGGRDRLLAEQLPNDLDVAGLLVDVGRLRPPQRVRAEGARIGARDTSPALDQLAEVRRAQALPVVLQWLGEGSQPMCVQVLPALAVQVRSRPN